MSPTRISLSNAQHYTWGGSEADQCDGWHLVKTAALSVIEERMPPGAEESRHRHERARQFFYILAGELVLELDGKVILLTAGEGLEIEPGAAHQAINRSAVDARFLVVSQPPGHGDRTNV